MHATKPTVLIVDDVPVDISNYYRGISRTNGYVVETAITVEQAIERASKQKFDAAIIDLVMPSGPFTGMQTDFDRETGYELAAQLVRMNGEINIVILSHLNEPRRLEPAFRERLRIRDVLRKEDTKPVDLVRCLDAIFGKRSMTPSVFIVHGHSRSLVEFAQKAVEEELKWERPIVLDEQAGGGLTIIEKFEKFASSAEAVLVLMSPDDVGSSRTKLDAQQFRARQNVLFELGYFYNKFKRHSGRVLLLREGELEMPSDLGGIVYIDVSGHSTAARDQIVRELQHAFRSFSET